MVSTSLWILLSSTYPAHGERSANGQVRACSEPPRDECLKNLVVKHRSALEELRSPCHDSTCSADRVENFLVELGLSKKSRQRAVLLLDELPWFDAANGKPMNQAAQLLLQTGHGTKRLGGSTSIGQVPKVKIAAGIWKFVLLKAEDSAGQVATLVRNTAGLAYHAEMAAAATGATRSGPPR